MKTQVLMVCQDSSRNGAPAWDVFCRYKTQRGYLFDRKAGWDTHGLPVELRVEKELGITKEDIEAKFP